MQAAVKKVVYIFRYRKFHNKFHNTFARCFENVTNAAKTVYEWSTQKAVTEERAKTLENEGSDINLIVSGDSTWKKRGQTSRFGVTTLAGKFSKKPSKHSNVTGM